MDTALMVPGFEGSIGPFPSEYADPHVYARSVNSGAGNCVCEASPDDGIHTEIAPGYPVPGRVAEMVAKSAEPQRFVLGIAYQAGPDPRIKKGVDGGRDFFSKEELELACWSYMRSGCPQMNAFHVDGTEDCAEPVESFIWRWPDWEAGDGIVVKDGDWCLGAILSPRMWELHKAGKVNGLSPEGVARRRRVAKEEAVPVAKGPAVADDDEEMTELVDARFKKVALVGQGANGVPGFLISKQDGAIGLVDPDTVRDLIAKAPQDTTTEGPVTDTSARERVTTPNGLTLTGSPADILSFIHKATLAGREDAPASYYEQVVKAKYDTADRKRMAASGVAMDGGEYPVADGDDLDKAIHAVGRGTQESHNAIRRHVIKRAKALGKSSMIPDNWASDGSLKSGVSKEEGAAVAAVAKDLMDAAGDATQLDDGMDGMDPTVPLGMPCDEDVPGDPADPGSPAWEAIDAATAAKWLSIAARLKNALGILAEREMLEAASADPGDAENAWDLQDAQCAVDYVISTLAVFAAGEQAEADLAGECMEMVGKALRGFDAGPLGVIEGLAEVRKAGRVLSAANEVKIRDAAKALGDVLASLPSAPQAAEAVTKEKGAVMPTLTIRQPAPAPAEPVAKAAPSAEDQARDTGSVTTGGTTGMGQPRQTGPDAALPGDGPQAGRPGDPPGRQVIKALRVAVYDQSGALAGITDPAAIVQRVAKADGDGEKKPMQAVFDQDGDLIGIVDPDAIMPVTGAGGKPDAGDGDGMQPGPAAAAAGDDDMTPQPAADAGTPADAVGKAAGEDVITVTQDVLKSIAQDAARTALDAQGAAHQEVVAKMAADRDELAEELKVVKARLATVEQHPAAPGVFTNGAIPPEGSRPVPPARMLRGQDHGTASGQVDVAKALERKRELYQAPDARQQDAIAKAMQGDAIAALTAIHSGRPVPMPAPAATAAGA